MGDAYFEFVIANMQEIQAQLLFDPPDLNQIWQDLGILIDAVRQLRDGSVDPGLIVPPFNLIGRSCAIPIWIRPGDPPPRVGQNLGANPAGGPRGPRGPLAPGGPGVLKEGKGKGKAKGKAKRRPNA